MAHVPAGGRNVLRLLALAGRSDIPVFLGSETPLSGSQEFPAEWRRASDELPGITLPEPKRSVEPRSAADYLLKRLLDAAHPVQVLALGPLTNLAEVFSQHARARPAPAGNSSSWAAPSAYPEIWATAERSRRTTCPPNGTCSSIRQRQKLYSPPARRFVSCRSTPRSAFPSTWRCSSNSSRAPTRRSQVSWRKCSPRIVNRFARDSILRGTPLAAAALANPAVVTFRPLAIEISDKPGELGRTVEVKNRRANAQVAIDADDLRFRDVFMTALGVKLGQASACPLSRVCRSRQKLATG